MKYICALLKERGGLAQLARALPWHGRGDRFESDMLHHEYISDLLVCFFYRFQTSQFSEKLL